MIRIELDERQARALACACAIARELLEPMREMSPSDAGEAPLEVAHSRLIAAMEVAGIEHESNPLIVRLLQGGAE